MTLLVMISSVRRGGLGSVRDAVAPFLDAAGYAPVRFETETAKPVPSRAVCVDMVKRSDIYLLLLGAEYGDPMPDTDLAPTAEEWSVARNEGKPIVVFKQAGITPEPRQQAFVDEIEAYQTGVFRGTFTDTGDLLGQLKDALAEAAALIQPMRPRQLDHVVGVPWRSGDRAAGWGQPALETHVIPVGAIDPLRATALSEVKRQLARVGRDQHLFGDGEALTFPIDEQAVRVERPMGGRLGPAGLSITTGRVISIWEALPTHDFGTVYDEPQVANRIARDLKVAAALGLLASGEVAVAVGIDRVESLGEATGPNSMTFPYMGSGRSDVRLEPSEAYATSALPRIAPELSTELAARLTLRLGQQ